MKGKMKGSTLCVFGSQRMQGIFPKTKLTGMEESSYAENGSAQQTQNLVAKCKENLILQLAGEVVCVLSEWKGSPFWGSKQCRKQSIPKGNQTGRRFEDSQ